MPASVWTEDNIHLTCPDVWVSTAATHAEGIITLAEIREIDRHGVRVRALVGDTTVHALVSRPLVLHSLNRGGAIHLTKGQILQWDEP